MEIIYSKAAVKALESMDKASKNRIRIGIMGLTQNPHWGISCLCVGTLMGDTGSV